MDEMEEQRTDVEFVVQKCKDLIRGQYLIRCNDPAEENNDKEDEVNEEERFTIPQGTLKWLYVKTNFYIGWPRLLNHLTANPEHIRCKNTCKMSKSETIY